MISGILIHRSGSSPAFRGSSVENSVRKSAKALWPFSLFLFGQLLVKGRSGKIREILIRPSPFRRNFSGDLPQDSFDVSDLGGVGPEDRQQVTKVSRID